MMPHPRAPKNFSNDRNEAGILSTNSDRGQARRAPLSAGTAPSVPPATSHPPDDVARIVAGTLEEFGRLDILVNNAGIAPMHPFLETTTELFDRVMAVNVRGIVCGGARLRARNGAARRT